MDIKRGFGYKNFKFFRLRTMYILNDKISGMTKKDRNEKNKKIGVISNKK